MTIGDTSSHWQLTYHTFTIKELGAKADIKLFKAIVGNPAHILYQLLSAHRPQGLSTARVVDVHRPVNGDCSTSHLRQYLPSGV